MMMGVYKLILDNGETVFIFAKTRTEAIRKYCKETGMPEGWLNAHCTVKNLGRVIE